MCKITAVNLTMCLPKCFVLVVNLFTFLIGVTITAAFTYGLITIKAILENNSLDFVFIGPIVFGCVIICISFLGFVGACLKNRCMIMTFAVLLLVILAVQVAVVVIVSNIIAQFNGFVDNTLYDTLMTATYDDIYAAVWDLIQQILQCCGVNSPTDWNEVTGETPWSCYKQNYTAIIYPQISDDAHPHYSQGQLFDRGCKKFVIDFVEDILRPVLIAVIVILVIQFCNVIFSCCMFFVYGRKSRVEKQKPYAVAASAPPTDY